MKIAPILAVALADFRERVRRRSFLVVTALVLWACFASVPPTGSNFSMLAFGDARGVYNSAWIGLQFGLTTVFLLPLPGFYLIKGAVNRDRRTRVGRVLLATPLSRWSYVTGKWLSNVALLSAILAIVSVGAIVMLVLRREAPGLDLTQLLRPMWLWSFPVLAIVAATAVVFECLRWLRSGFGNVAYFFLWSFSLVIPVEGATDATGGMVTSNDPFGVSHALSEAQSRVAAEVPGYGNEFRLSIGHAREGGLRVLDWPPASWEPQRLWERLSWLSPSLVLLLGAALAFDRFDPSREGRRQDPARRTWFRGRRRAGSGSLETAIKPTPASVPAAPPEAAELPPAVRSGGRQVLVLVAAELRLLVRGQPGWWWLVLAGLMVASLLTPPVVSHANLLPFLWIWPVLLWSALGARERLEGVAGLLESSPGAAWRRTLAEWTAGTLLAVAVAAPLAVRLLLALELERITAVAAGALFVPALAVCSGVLTQGSRTFEALYLVWWYMAINGERTLDFMGRDAGRPIAYGGLTAVLLVTAFTWRWLQSRR